MSSSKQGQVCMNKYPSILPQIWKFWGSNPLHRPATTTATTTTSTTTTAAVSSTASVVDPWMNDAFSSRVLPRNKKQGEGHLEDGRILESRVYSLLLF